MASDIDALLKAAAAGGGGGGSVTQGPLIPVRGFGTQAHTVDGSTSVNAAEYGLKHPEPKTDLLSPDAAAVSIYGWSLDEQKKFARQAWSLGLLKSPSDLGGAFSVWSSAVQAAGNFAAAGNPMDPRDALDLLAAGDPDAIKRRQQLKYAGQTIVSQKANPIDLTDPAQVKTMLQQAFQVKMGRDPTDAELRTAIATLHAKEQANPGSTKVATTYDENGNVTQQRQLPGSGGVDPGQFINDTASNDPESAEYQASSAYFPALLQALAGPSGLGG